MPASMGGPGGAFVFNGSNYAPANFPGGTGFQFGGGRENALGSSAGGGYYQPQPGLLSSIGGNIGGGLRGIGMLLGRLAGSLGNIGGAPSNGITPSAGGWAIDKNGNLVSTGSTSTASSPNQTRSGPSPISHTTSIPGWAASAMANTRARNLL